MSNLPRITYSGVNVDFDRHLNVYRNPKQTLNNKIRSLSGLTETINFYSLDRFTIGKNRLSAIIEPQLVRFWEYAKSGQVFSFRFDRDLLAYMAFEGVLTTNDDVAGTLTRADAAYYKHPYTSLLTLASANTGRFPAGVFGRGILIESAGTNILTRGNEFDNAAWTATNITVAANTTETKDHKGTNTADKLTSTASDGTLRNDTGTSIGTDDAVFSVYLRAFTGGTANTVTLKIIRADTGATLASATVNPTVNWEQYSVSYNSSGSIAANWGVVIEIDQNGTIFYAANADLKVGAGERYATSAIDTVAASASRAADILTYQASSIFDDLMLTGSISFWFTPLFTGSNNEKTHVLFDLESSGGTATSVCEMFISSSNDLTFEMFSPNNLARFAVSVTSGNWTVGQTNHIAVTWNCNVSLNSATAIIYINGVAANSSTIAFSFVPARIGTYFRVGSGGSSFASALPADGVFDDFEIRRDVLTAEEVYSRYISGKALGWRKNHWASLILDQEEYDPKLVIGSWRHDIELNFIEQLS